MLTDPYCLAPSFFAGQPELANFSDGGEFHPYLVRIEAPVSLFAASSKVTIGNLTRQIVAGPPGEYYIATQAGAVPGVYLAIPSESAGPSISVGELEDLYYNFAAGVCSGGIDLVEGTYTLCNSALMEGAKLSPLGFIWETSYGGHFRSELSLALDTGRLVKQTANLIWDITENDVDIVKGLFKGNVKPSYVSQSYRKALSYGAEILRGAEQKFEDLSPEDRAYYAGRIFFEAATITTAAGKAGNLAKLRKANFLEMFAASRLCAETPEIAGAVEELAPFKTALYGTKVPSEAYDAASSIYRLLRSTGKTPEVAIETLVEDAFQLVSHTNYSKEPALRGLANAVADALAKDLQLTDCGWLKARDYNNDASVNAVWHYVEHARGLRNGVLFTPDMPYTSFVAYLRKR